MRGGPASEASPDPGLFVFDEGSGDPPLVFLHGWCCRHEHFRRQLDFFRPHHRVIAPDLRGHGASGRGTRPLDLATLAEDVVQLCRQRELDRPVIVGHSLGGMLAVEAALRTPVSGLVIVDAPLSFDAVQVAGFGEVIAGLAGPEGESVRRAFLQSAMSVPGDDPAIVRRVEADMSSVPLDTATAILREVPGWEGVSLAARCDAPILAVMADRDLARAMADAERALPHLTVARVYGSGHFAQLQVPDQVNAMIERFLGLLPRGFIDRDD